MCFQCEVKTITMFIDDVIKNLNKALDLTIRHLSFIIPFSAAENVNETCWGLRLGLKVN